MFERGWITEGAYHTKEIPLKIVLAFNRRETCVRRDVLAPVVQKVDNAVHWRNLYPLDSAIVFPNTYLLDSDLSGG